MLSFKRIDKRMSNVGLPERKLPRPVFLAIVVAIIVFGVSYFVLQNLFAAERITVPVPAARSIIPQGAVIVKEDVIYHPLSSVPPGCIANAGLVVGKAALSTIYEGEMFRRERVGDALSGKQEVTLNTDLARSGLTAPGDLVDIYLIRDEANWYSEGELVASDAVVHSVRDIQGAEVVSGKLPAVVQVVVEAADIAKLVHGTGVKNDSYALIKKYSKRR